MRHSFKLTKRSDSPFWCWTSYILGKRARGTTSQPGHKRHEAEAKREACAAWLAECARRGAKVPETIEEPTVKVLVDRFCDDELPARAKKRNPRYADQLETDLVKYLEPRFTLLSELTPHAWGRWMAECHTRKTPRPIKLRSVQRVTSSANVFLRWCTTVGALKEAPTLPYPEKGEVEVEQADRRAFTRTERDAFLVALEGLDGRAHRIYTVLLYSALRKSGLERLQKRWIDFGTGYVTFPARALKDKGSRTFWLRPEALVAIEEEHKAAANITPDRPVFGPFDFDGHNGPKKSGLFWTALTWAGIKDRHGLTAHHVTRHTACTIAGLEGATLAELMALGGWKRPEMAMRYLHIDAEAAKRAAERL